MNRYFSAICVILLLICACASFGDSIVNLPKSTKTQSKNTNTKDLSLLDKASQNSDIAKIPTHSNNPYIHNLKSQKKALSARLRELNKQSSKPPTNQNIKSAKIPQSTAPSSASNTLNTLERLSAISSTKPKVLLIMDDLSSQSQIDTLLALKLNITPSIFPPTKYHPNTPKIAQNLVLDNRTFMLHLPLEALNFEQKDLEPIKVGTNMHALRARLGALRRDFPHLTYINNHTGSKYTQSRVDMENLLEIFDEFDFKFIDSITTPYSASEAISREQNRLIMQRDIFLDNEISIEHTKTQLKTLISTAQKNGYAIAICHPHSSTFEALRQMQNEILREVELISPNELESHLLENEITQYKRYRFYAKQ